MFHECLYGSVTRFFYIFLTRIKGIYAVAEIHKGSIICPNSIRSVFESSLSKYCYYIENVFKKNIFCNCIINNVKHPINILTEMANCQPNSFRFSTYHFPESD